MDIPFVGPAYQSRSVPWNAQRCVNLYPEAGGTQSKTPAALLGTPGLRLWATLPTGPVNGLHVFGGSMYAAAGSTLYEVQSSVSIVSRGTIGTGYSRMADNGLQLAIANGSSYYVYKISDQSLTLVSGFNPTPQVLYADGYFIGFDPGTQEFFISAVLDGTAFDAADFASAEASPDKLVAIAIRNRELFAFGANSTEVWINTGNADFPFERSGNTVMEVGCSATHSVALLSNALYWLGNDGRNGGRVVYRCDAYQPVRISTHGIEAFLESLDDLSDARALTYTQDGHAYYCLTVGGRTFCYDLATQLWHERAVLVDGNLSAWRANCHAYFDGKHIVGDATSGNLYTLDLDYFADDSAANGVLLALRSTGPQSASNARGFFSALQVDVQPGVGLSTGQGSDPQMMLRYSDDGGFTWSNQHVASMGAQGRYLSRVIFRRLGSSRNRVWEVSISDPVKRAIFGAQVNG